MYRWVVVVALIASCIGCFGVAAGSSTAPSAAVGRLTINSEAAPGVKVYAIAKGDDAAMKIQATTTTDADGAFYFASLPSLSEKQQYVFVAYEPHKLFAYGWQNWTGLLGRNWFWAHTGTGMNPDLTRMTIEKLKEERGVVVDDTGKPVPGAVVSPRGSEFSSIFDIKSATSDAEGRYVLEGGADSVTRDGYTMKMIDRNADGVTVTMNRAGTISGSITNYDAKAHAGVQLTAYRSYNGSVYTAAISPNGRFNITGLRVDSYTMELKSTGDAFLINPVKDLQVAAGAVVDAGKLAVVRAAKISGRIVDADTGEPVKASVTAKQQIPDGDKSAEKPARFSMISEKDGSFSMSVVPGLTYELEASGILGMHDGNNLKSQSRTVAVPAGGVKDLEVKLPQPHMIRGQVIDSKGAPAAGVFVNVWGGYWDYKNDNYIPYSFCLTDAQGRFELPLCKRGMESKLEEKFRVGAADDSSWQSGVEMIIRDKIDSPVTIRLKPGGQRSVKVIDEAGKPLEGVGIWSGWSLNVTDKEGTVTIHDLHPFAPVGPKIVFKPGYSETRLPFKGNEAPSSQPITVTLKRGSAEWFSSQQ